MNMLSVCFKNVVGAMRQSWRTLNNEDKDKDENQCLERLQKLVTDELQAKCDEILSVLKDQLIPVVEDLAKNQAKDKDDSAPDYHHQKVFYLKMAGDYYRYICEFQTNNQSAKEKADSFYTQALKIAELHLQQTNPTRLGFGLECQRLLL
eukprot:UN33554